jgi:hypothetical protein
MLTDLTQIYLCCQILAQNPNNNFNQNPISIIGFETRRLMDERKWMDRRTHKFTTVCPLFSLYAKAHKKSKKLQVFSNIWTETYFPVTLGLIYLPPATQYHMMY